LIIVVERGVFEVVHLIADLATVLIVILEWPQVAGIDLVGIHKNALSFVLV